MLMRPDVALDGAETALESKRLQPLQAHHRIGNALTEQLVQVGGIAAENSGLLFLPDKTMGLLVEIVRLEPSELGTGDTGTALQLSEVDSFQGEIIPLLGLHFVQGL